MNVFDLHCFDQDIVNSFKSDRFVFANFRDVIACLIDVGIAKHDECSGRWIENQFECRFQNQNTGALRSDQRSRDLKILFWQKIV